MEEKKIKQKLVKALERIVSAVMPWIFLLIAAIVMYALTSILRIHQVAMIASISFACLGFVVFVTTYVLGNRYNGENEDRKSSQMTPFRSFLILVSIAMFLMFVPVYDTLEGGAWRTFCLSIHNTMRLFVLDGDFAIINDYLASDYALNGVWAGIFREYSVFMFILAPIMSAGFVLSFVKDFWSQILSVIRRGKEIYYMSELNKSSIALARNIKEKNTKAIVVFFDVYHEQSEEHHELVERAIRYGAICFRKDIASVGLKRRRSIRKFFFIGVNEEENLKQAIDLVGRCDNGLNKKEKAEFYIFATTADSEFLVDALAERVKHQGDRLKIRRVDVTKNLAFNMVQEDCYVFPRATDKSKNVNVVIVGIGSFGSELLKTYSWVSKIPGATTKIHLIDKDEKLREKIMLYYPELLEPKIIDPNEPKCTVETYPGIDVNYSDFEKKIEKIQQNKIDVVYVCLGDDQLNVKTAMTVRRVIGRTLGADEDLPIIKTVVFSTRKSEILNDNKNDKDITYIGSMGAVYSLKNIDNTDNEKSAKQYHMYWAICDLKGAFDKIKENISRNKLENTENCDTRIENETTKFLSENYIHDEIKDEIRVFGKKLKDVVSKFKMMNCAVRDGEKVILNPDIGLDKIDFSARERELYAMVEFIEKDKSLIGKTLERHRKIERNRTQAYFKEVIKIANEILVLSVVYYKGKLIDSERRYNIEEYCRRSSTARAVHVNILEKLGYSIKEGEREDWLKLEHYRWNAFMRAEGYVYVADNALKSERTKMHDLIKNYEDLSDYDKEKDGVYDLLNKNNGENK